MEKERAVRVFNRQAKQYARRREDPRVTRWRRSLLQDASGRVLELAVGAGANFPHYPAGVRVTAVDFSEGMLAQSRQAAEKIKLDAEFICADIDRVDFPQHVFDTVVSTLSLCAYEEPLKVLRSMQRWCKPDGRILLLEHGVSSNAVISLMQKIGDPILYRIIGCHQTRNITELTEESGLSVERMESRWFNTVHLIWAKPGPGY